MFAGERVNPQTPTPMSAAGPGWHPSIHGAHLPVWPLDEQWRERLHCRMQSAGLTVSLSLSGRNRMFRWKQQAMCEPSPRKRSRFHVPTLARISTHRTRGLPITPGSQRTGAGSSFPPSFHESLTSNCRRVLEPAYLTGLDTINSTPSAIT